MKNSILICLLVFLVISPRIGAATPTFQEGFDKHNSIMLLIDPSMGSIVDANQAASKFYGYSRDVLKSMKIQDINLLTPAQVKDEIKLAKTQGRNFFIFRHQMKNGDARTVEVYSIPMKFDGKTLLYSVIQDISSNRDSAADRWHYEQRLEEMVDLQTQDIQEKTKLTVFLLSIGLMLLLVVIVFLTYVLKRRREAENALSDSEKRYKSSAKRMDEIIRGTDIGTWEWDVRTGEIVINDRWAETIGYKIEEISPLTFETWMIFMQDEDAAKARDLLKKHFQKELEYFEFDARMKHKRGNWLWVLFKGKVVEWGDDGKPLRMSGTQKHISERKEYEAELEEARISAESANLVKSQFLATMSHEIRTPMTGVIGYSDMLLDDDLPEESRDKVIKIKNSTNSLLSIINDILDMSKMEAGKMDLEKLDFHLPSLIESVITLFDDQHLKNDHLTLVSRFAEILPKAINADPTRLRQILVNLVGNAVKFTQNGTVTIHADLIPTEVGRDMLYFCVEDQGIGIAEETVDQIFSEFTQADTSTSRVYEGTGLGLAICKNLVELSGGTIGVESVLDQGSKFWFTLPFVPATSDVDKCETENLDQEFEARRSLKILIAEDNPVNQHIVKAFVENYGHRAVIVDNGLRAIGAVNEGDFDLVLMDVRMPQMSGPEATQIIRRSGGSRCSVPIIALTADAMKENVTSYIAAGMNDCVTKPFEKSELLLTINKVLNEEIHRPIGSVTTEYIEPQKPLLSEQVGDTLVQEEQTQDLEEHPPIGDDKKADAFMKLIGIGEAQSIFLQATENLDQQIKDLQEGLKEEDPTKVLEVAHSIKGASGSLYGTRMSGMAEKVQQHASNLHLVAELMPNLEKTAKETIAWWREKADIS